MTVKDATRGTADLKALVASDPDFVRTLMRTALQEVLEAEMTETVGAAKGERTEDRLGYRAGYYGRTLVTRVGKLELRVPQDRDGSVLDRAVRALPALRAGLGRGPGRDVRAGGLDAEGQGDHRGAVRPPLLGLEHQRDQPAAGREPGPVRRPSARGGLSLPDPGCPLRAGPRGRRHPQPSAVSRRPIHHRRCAGQETRAGRCWSRWRSAGTAGAACWASSSPTGRAGRAGATSCSG